MSSTPIQIISLVIGVMFAVFAAIYLVKLGVSTVGYVVSIREVPQEETEQETVTEEQIYESGARAVDGFIKEREVEVRKKTAYSTQITPSEKRASNVVFTYDSFGTYWKGSFVPRTFLARGEIPAVRVMIHNTGNAPTQAWSLECNFQGVITRTNQYPLSAGERAFAVCDSVPLPFGTQYVTVSYQEIGKEVRPLSASIMVR